MTASESNTLRELGRVPLSLMSDTIKNLRGRNHHALADALTLLKESWAREVGRAAALAAHPKRCAEPMTRLDELHDAMVGVHRREEERRLNGQGG